MKGWIYVITNKAMPGLVKVGYSMKDPELRAEELNHTGSPHPYLVEYELLIDEPYQVEQKTHKLLSAKREAKEWFRCSPEEAVAAIKQIAGDRTITETYKRAERAKVEELRQQQRQQKQEAKRKEDVQPNYWVEILSSRLNNISARVKNAEARIKPFLKALMNIEDSDVKALIAYALMHGKREEVIKFGGEHGISKTAFEEAFSLLKCIDQIERPRGAEITAVRSPIVACGQCGKKIRFPAGLRPSGRRSSWNCPACNAPVSPFDA